MLRSNVGLAMCQAAASLDAQLPQSLVVYTWGLGLQRPSPVPRFPHIAEVTRTTAWFLRWPQSLASPAFHGHAFLYESNGVGGSRPCLPRVSGVPDDLIPFLAVSLAGLL